MVDDNISRSGTYGTNDIGLEVGVKLGGIDKSLEDASTLADYIKQWRDNNEAFIRSLSDTQEALNLLTTEFETQKRLRLETVSAEEQLRDLTAQIRDNARSTSQAYQEMSGIISTMNTNLGGAASIPGIGPMNAQGSPGAIFGGYQPGTSWEPQPTTMPPSSSGSSPGPSAGTSPGATPGAFEDMDFDVTRSGGGGGGGGGSNTSGWLRNLKGMGVPGRGNNQELDEIQRVLSLPGWGRTGKIGSYARYANRVTNGKLFEWAASKPGIVGSRVWDEASHSHLARSLAQRDIESQLASGTVSTVDDALLHNTFTKYNTMAKADLISAAGGESSTLVSEASNMGKLAGGLIGRAGMAAEAVAAPMAVAALAYQGYKTVQQAGQQYSSLTGATGEASYKGAAGNLWQALTKSDFGLNARVGFGDVTEMQNMGLSRGYRGDTQRKFVDFAYSAKSEYGMSSQDSMAFFHDAVVKAGASVNQLKANLDALAHTAATSQTSKDLLIKRATTYTSMLTSIGASGNFASDAATAGASTMAGDLKLENSANELNMFSSIGGQAMVASAAGIPLSQVYGTMAHGTTAQKNGLLGASENFIRGKLQSIVGVSPTSANFQAAVESKSIQLMYVLTALVPPVGDQPAWTQQTAVEYTTKILKHQGGVGENVIGAATKAIQDLAGGKSLKSEEGMSNFFTNVARKEKDFRDTSLHGHTATETVFQYKDSRGKSVTATLSEVQGKSLKEKEQIYRQIAASGRHIAQGYYDDSGKLVTGKFRTLGGVVGNDVLGAMESGKISQQQLLGISPEAQWLVKLVKNPGSITQSQYNHIANIGRGANTSSWSQSQTVNGNPLGAGLGVDGYTTATYR